MDNHTADPKNAQEPQTNDNGSTTHIKLSLQRNKILDYITNRITEYKSTGCVSLSGLSSGFSNIDQILDGFQQGNLITLAGRTSMGKTWVALNFINNIAIIQKIPIGFYTLEMSESEIIFRLLSLHSGIPIHVIKSGTMNEDQFKLVENSYREISESPLYITDNQINTKLSTLINNIKQSHHENNFKLVIIDLIGHINTSSSSNKSNRPTEVGEITKALRGCGKELKIPIMILAQLNRLSATKGKPELIDLSESGSLEQDSDVVMFVHRDNYYNSNNNENKIEIIIAKNKHGEQNIHSEFYYCKDTWALSPRKENGQVIPATVDHKVNNNSQESLTQKCLQAMSK